MTNILNENFNRFAYYKPSFSGNKTLVKEIDDMLPKLIALIESGDSTNIEMAFEIAEGQRVFYRLYKYLDETYKPLLNGKDINIKNLADLFTSKRYELPAEDEYDVLPSSIGKLINLEQLYLGWGYLTEIPDSVGNLKKLKHLILFGNSLSVLPDSICNLFNLRLLNLSGNKISRLPDNIGNLQELKYLYLNNTEIKQLPKSLFQLPNLTLLEIRETLMSEDYISYIKKQLPNTKIKSK